MTNCLGNCLETKRQSFCLFLKTRIIRDFRNVHINIFPPSSELGVPSFPIKVKKLFYFIPLGRKNFLTGGPAVN